MADIDLSTSRRALLTGALGLGGVAALAPGGPAAGAPIPTDPSSRYFLRVRGVDGESTDAAHPQEIELLTWTFGVTSNSSPLGRSGAGRSKPGDLVFVARTSTASPELYQLVCTGRRVPDAFLSAVRVTDTREEYLTVKFEDLIITSYQVAPGESDGFPIDVGHLSYARIIYTYRSQDPNGGPGPSATFGFDFGLDKTIQP